MRSVGAILLGLLTGLVVIFAIEFASSRLYPLPSGIDPGEPGAMARAFADMPLGAFLFVLCAYLGGSIVGTWVAARIGRGTVPGVVVGVLLLGSGIANMLWIPHPAWFWIAAIAIFGVGTFVGTRLAGTSPGQRPMTAGAAGNSSAPMS